VNIILITENLIMATLNRQQRKWLLYQKRTDGDLYKKIPSTVDEILFSSKYTNDHAQYINQKLYLNKSII
jgi:hypothetical protein